MGLKEDIELINNEWEKYTPSCSFIELEAVEEPALLRIFDAANKWAETFDWFKDLSESDQMKLSVTNHDLWNRLSATYCALQDKKV